MFQLTRGQFSASGVPLRDKVQLPVKKQDIVAMTAIRVK